MSPVLRRALPALVCVLTLVALPGAAVSAPVDGTVAVVGTPTQMGEHVVFDSSSTQTWAMISVSNPDPGTWRLTFVGADAPSVQSPCFVVVEMDPMSDQVDCPVTTEQFARGVEIYSGDGDDYIEMEAGILAPLIVHPEKGFNTMVGGDGNDFFDLGSSSNGSTVNYMTGNGGTDTWTLSQGWDQVIYDQHASGVNVTWDCLPNDGNAEDGVTTRENVGCHANNSALNGVTGSNYNDTITGDDGSQAIYGGYGNDNIDARGGSDMIRGQGDHDYIVGGAGTDSAYGDDPTDPTLTGSDTLDMRDGAADGTVNCGPAEDLVKLDGSPAAPSESATGCENVTYALANPTPPAPAPPAGPSVSNGHVNVSVQDTTETFKFGSAAKDDLRGYNFDEIMFIFAFAKGLAIDIEGTPVFMTRNRLPKHPRGEKWREGDNITSLTGQTITHAAGKPAKLKLKYWGGPNREACIKEAQWYEGYNIDEFREIMADFGCKIDDVLPTFVKKVKGADRCEVAEAVKVRKRTELDVVVNVPRNPAKHDLFIYLGNLRPGAAPKTNQRVDTLGLLAPGWTLAKSNKTNLRGAVSTRSGNWAGNVTVYVDTSAVNGGDRNYTDSFSVKTSMSRDAPGEFQTGTMRFKKEGRIDILALGLDRVGNAVCGATSVNVRDFKRKSGTILTSVTGRRYEYTPGEAKPFLYRADLTRGAVSRAKGAATADFWSQVTNWWNSLWSGKPNAPAAPSASTAETEGRGVVQLAPGAALSGNAKPAQITNGTAVAVSGATHTGTGTAPLVAAGAGNLVFATTGLVAAGAGNLVAAGAGNLVAAGAGNMGGPPVDMKKSTVVEAEGVGLVAAGAGNLVAAGAGNLVAAGAGNLVAAGAGN